MGEGTQGIGRTRGTRAIRSYLHALNRTKLVGLVFELAPRATEVAETWAANLARRELGESLITITSPVKLVRRGKAFA